MPQPTTPEQNKEPVCIACIQPDGVTRFHSTALEAQPLIGHVGWASQLTRARESQQQQVQDEAIVLRRGKGAWMC